MTKIITIILVVLLGYIGYEAYQVYSEVTTVPVENTIKATSTDMDGNEISNLPDERFGGDGQEDPVTGPMVFTLADIAYHNSSASCYTAVRGVVYDLTAFMTKHPGGAANILKICGKDGSSAFERKYGGRPEPEQELKGHEIGILAK